MARGPRKDERVEIQTVERQSATFFLLGTSPIIFNRISEVSMQELLLPKPPGARKKSGALKHDPMREFAASFYTTEDGDCEDIPDATMPHIAIPGGAIKAALAAAAIDQADTKRAVIGRLTAVPFEYCPVFGIPEIRCTMVRSADMARTPDVRTRATIRRWVAVATVSYAYPLLNLTQVSTLLEAAGQTIGIGDWRSEKGKGSFGSFRLARNDEPEVVNIMRTGDSDAQLAALANPAPYNAMTARLLQWFDSEVARRGDSSKLAPRIAHAKTNCTGAHA